MKKKKKQLFKHQVLVTSILVGAVVISTLGGSYAWFNSQIMNDEYNAFKEEDFEVSYVDNGTGYGDILSLVNQMPISDEEGEKLTPYRFNVTNLGSEEKKFSLKIVLDESIIEEDGCIGKLLETSYIKYKIDNQEPKVLGTLAEKDYIIYTSNETIMPGSSEIHELRIWIASDSPKVVSDKHFHAKVSVEETDKTKTYATYTTGQAVTLLDGTKYHVLENSSSKDSKVKLISDYNIDASGSQDTKCVVTDFIKNKVTTEEQLYYCSTMTYEQAVSVLYGNFLTQLQTNLMKYEKIDNVEVKLPELKELKQALNIIENQEVLKTDLINLEWLTNLNFWSVTNNNQDINYNWTLSTDLTNISLKQHSKDSKYFGLRPVIVIDKENIRK